MSDALDVTDGNDAAPMYAQQVANAQDDELIRRARDVSRRGPKPPDTTTPPEPPPFQQMTVPDSSSTFDMIASDIGTGIGESPGALVRGVVAGADELAGAIDDTGAWLAIQAADTLGDEGTAQRIREGRASGEQALGALIPDVDPSKSVTGNLIQGITQFATGFVAGGKVLKGLGLLTKIEKGAKIAGLSAEAAAKLATGSGVVLKSGFSDAFAFDPAQQRLSNLLRDHAGLRDPVTEFLASKPGDSAALGRFKNALEGLGVGLGASMLFASALKGYRFVESAAKSSAKPADETVTAAMKNALAPLGDESKPLVSFAKKEDGTNEVYINTLRINESDDVKALLQRSANLVSGSIEEAQRGKITFEQTAALADDLGMTVEDLVSRRRGPNNARAPMTAEEVTGARMILNASTKKLEELTLKAGGPNAGQVDRFNFRKHFATHYAIMQEVFGARTEGARALAAWRMSVGHGPTQMRAVEQALEASRGDTDKLLKEMTRAFTVGKGEPGALNQYVRASAFPGVVKGLRSVYVNSLLAGFGTHIWNFTGNLGMLPLGVMERSVARMISKATGSNAVAPGESLAMLHGVIMSQAEAWRLGYRALRYGETSGNLLSKVDVPRSSAIGSARQDGYGKSLNVIGTAFNSPSLAMASSDEVFRHMQMRGDLHAQALRQATSEGLEGAALTARADQLVQKPPAWMQFNADEEALSKTFNSRMGWFGQALMTARDKGGPLNPLWLITPFLRTITNLSRAGFERSPLAPLVGQWREDVAAGGVRRDMALARTVTGTSIMGIFQMMARGDLVTGPLPDDPKKRELWRREKRAPYSIKIGGDWYSYNFLDPIATPIGLAVNIEERLRLKDVSPKDVDSWGKVMDQSILAVSKNVMNKNMLRGYGQLFDAISDPARYRRREIASILHGFIPFSGLAGEIEKLADPTVREGADVWQDIQERLPFLSSRLIPARDLWGRDPADPDHILNIYSPSKRSQESIQPADAELARLGYFPDDLGWKEYIDGVAIDFSDYGPALDQYRKLAGNEYKHPAWGLGLMDYLNAVVTGKHDMSQVYQMLTDGPEGGKMSFIANTISEYRELAQRELLDDPNFADFRAEWERQQAAERAATQKYNLQ